MSNNHSIQIMDRVASCLTYLTAGWFGLIYFVILYFQKKSPSLFLRYNLFQSIFISLLLFVLSMTLGLISNLLLAIPFIKVVVSWIILVFNRPVFFEYSIIQFCITALVFYLAGFSLLGKYPKVYGVSKIIENAMR